VQCVSACVCAPMASFEVLELVEWSFGEEIERRENGRIMSFGKVSGTV
jgi:hypothetical protein